ncbi:MAG TPA: hypothetical protein VF494_07295 [Candidatus Limnocylindrales bacterium]
MNRLLLWITTAILGVTAVLMTSLGLIALLAALLLAVAVVLRADHRVVALSGLLTGFGALWSVLMAGQLGSEGTTNNVAFWTAVGIVPLALGCALIVPIVARTMRSRPVAQG